MSARSEATIAAVAVVLVIGAIKHAAGAYPAHAAVGVAAAVAWQLYVPLAATWRRRDPLRRLGLHPDAWRTDLRWLLGLSAATVAPFAAGHHVWQTALCDRSLQLRLPDGISLSVLGAVLPVIAVALAEEVYFRGYLQERLTVVWPPRRRLFGTPVGRAVVVTSAVFALAHFAGDYRLHRLGPFFPSLLFGFLRARTGSVLAAAGYHAVCNLMADALSSQYRAAGP